MNEIHYKLTRDIELHTKLKYNGINGAINIQMPVKSTLLMNRNNYLPSIIPRLGKIIDTAPWGH